MSPKQKSTKFQGQSSQTRKPSKSEQKPGPKPNLKNEPCKYCGVVGHYSINCMKEINKWNHEKPKSEKEKIVNEPTQTEPKTQSEKDKCISSESEKDGDAPTEPTQEWVPKKN